MPRSKRKQKRVFFKIKEKLVLIPTKKFVGRRLLGVSLLIVGSLILFFSVAYFYILPAFFPKQTSIVKVVQEKESFSPERIIIPSIGVDLTISNEVVSGAFPKSMPKLSGNDQIIVLGKGEYEIFSSLETSVGKATASGNVKMEEDSIRLIIPVLTSPKKSLNIVGRKVIEN